MWNPEQYLKFGAERERPAMDLLARIPLAAPETAYDLGCGAGNVTAMLKRRWPEARVEAWDASEQMLEKARKLPDDIRWVRRDLTEFDAYEGADLMFCNAVLHFVDDHPRVLRELMGKLNPGGVLAVHIPNNFRQPSHASITEAAVCGPWKSKLEGLAKKREMPVLEPERYYEVLQPLASSVELWQTVYHQFLEGENPVMEWFKGSALLPFVELLETQEEKDAFTAEYGRRVKAAYKKAGDGKTVFPFHRLFFLAVK